MLKSKIICIPHFFLDCTTIIYDFQVLNIIRFSDIIPAVIKIVDKTLLTVYPASGLINYFRGKNLVLINRDTTPFDNRADLVINDGLGKVFGEI